MSKSIPCLVLLCALPLLAAGCEVEGAQCVDLREQVMAKEATLPRACQIDQECFIVETLPDRLVAVSAMPDDPELEVSVATWEQDCSPTRLTDQRRLVPSAFDTRCQLFRGEVTGTERQLCAITFQGELVNPNDPTFELPPEAFCDCAADGECATGELCEGGCLCLPRCEAACRHIASCSTDEFDALRELGFGTTIEACVSSCEVNLFDETLREVELPCLASATCDQIASCIQPISPTP